MANETFIVGLSGREIIKDVLHQVEEALRKDCNLRDSDSYGQGYSGKITLELSLQALDTVIINMSVEVKISPALQQQAENKEPEKPEVPEGSTAEQISKDITVKAEKEIEIEKDLNAVRERSKQSIPEASVGGTSEPEQAGESTVNRRTYRNPVQGGALEAPEGL